MEAAFWDIRGKVENKPVWGLLGGEKPGPVPVYASTGEIHPPEQRAEELIKLHESGFSTVKLRVHSFDLEEDIRQIETIRKAVPESLTIGVDANQGWRVALIDDAPLWDLDRAVEFSKACKDNHIAWIEEPLEMYAYDDLATLRKRSEVPIAGCELNGGWHEFKVMLEKGSFDIYQPDATMGGGITDAKRLFDECVDRGLGFTPHTWTNGLGFLINLHVHASGANEHPIEYPYESPSWVPEARDGILQEPILVSDQGTVHVPEEPGFGFHLDDNKLAHYSEKYFEITSRGIAVKTIRENGLFTALKLARKKNR
jgi:L-alanine-DL-glutamate epimerase-like enolase superfamily enzyme